MQSIRAIVKAAKALKPKYSYKGEIALNPAYETMSWKTPILDKGEHRIFAFRGDNIVATGVKNLSTTRESWKTVINQHNQHLVSRIDRF